MKLLLLATLISFYSCQESKDLPGSVVNNWDLDDWKIKWQDEFEGTAIDLSKWSYEQGGHGWGNNELQYYTNDSANAFIRDGKLVLTANVIPQGRLSSGGLRYFSSARLRTLGKGDWKYGRIEVRAKIALGQGIWPAIWLLPTERMYGGWPSSGEIDIMEHVGHDEGNIHGSVHTEIYNHKIGTQRGKNKNLNDIKNKFYTYAIEWDSDQINFFIDGNKYFLFQNDKKNDYKSWPFNQRFHLLLNIAVGGDWPGPPDSSTNFPVEMEVDYVRVYDKKN